MKLIKLEQVKIIPKQEITYFLNPDYIYIPLNKEKLKVKQDEKINKAELITEHIYSPISGIAYGLKNNTLVIENDFKEWTKHDECKMDITIPNIIDVISKSNNKTLLNKFKSNKKFNNIIITAIDENPYVYNKIYLLKENINNILELINKLSIIYGSNNNYLVIKSNMAYVIDAFLDKFGTYPNISLSLVNDEYLISREENIKERLKINNSYLILDIEELITLSRLLTNKITTTKLITISGDAIESSIVMRVKNYTLLSDVIDKYIKFITSDYDVIVNGVMTGFIIDNIKDFIITPDVMSITFMKKRKIITNKCIKCGKCISICPQNVNILTKKNIDKCIDCGLCSYICPSYINNRKKK